MMAKFGLILVAIFIGVAVGFAEGPKELTEVQKLKGEILKLQIQVTAKDQQLAQCRMQILEGPARAMELEYLKQVGAEPNDQWDWATMTARKPASEKK